jgi:predicted transcriptional regulator of viral defense system
MVSKNELIKEFKAHYGIMRTSELGDFGLNSRQIKQYVDENVLSKIKTGIYELSNQSVPDEIIIAKLFPTGVLYLESALLYYDYTDRIPAKWQIAVNKNISKPQFKIDHPAVTPFYIDKKYIEIGVTSFEVSGTNIRIYDRDRTICDVLRYANKLEKEVFNQAVQRYVRDNKRNVTKLMEYAKILRVTEKVKMYIGVWL